MIIPLCGSVGHTVETMQLQALLYSVAVILVVLGVDAAKDKKDSKKKLQIGIKKRIDADKCKTKSRKGDSLTMHYTVGASVCWNVCLRLCWITESKLELPFAFHHLLVVLQNALANPFLCYSFYFNICSP